MTLYISANPCLATTHTLNLKEGEMSEQEIYDLGQTPPCEIENCKICAMKEETVEMLMEGE